jgi:hypothetical protein
VLLLVQVVAPRVGAALSVYGMRGGEQRGCCVAAVISSAYLIILCIRGFAFPQLRAAAANRFAHFSGSALHQSWIQPALMFLCALGNAVPDSSLSQLECFEILKQHRAYESLSARGKEICKVVLTGDNGITRRSLPPSLSRGPPELTLSQAILHVQLHVDS